MYNNLCEMGYPDTSAKEALRQANNDMDIALQVKQAVSRKLLNTA